MEILKAQAESARKPGIFMKNAEMEGVRLAPFAFAGPGGGRRPERQKDSEGAWKPHRRSVADKAIVSQERYLLKLPFK